MQKKKKEKLTQPPLISLAPSVLFSSLHTIGSEVESVDHQLYFSEAPTSLPEE